MTRLTSQAVHYGIHQSEFGSRFFKIHLFFYSGVFLVILVLLLFAFLATAWRGMSSRVWMNCSVSVVCVPKEVAFWGKNSWRLNEIDVRRVFHGVACGFLDPFSLPLSAALCISYAIFFTGASLLSSWEFFPSIQDFYEGKVRISFWKISFYNTTQNRIKDESRYENI